MVFAQTQENLGLHDGNVHVYRGKMLVEMSFTGAAYNYDY